jgi:hypothetical protein
MKKIKKLIGFNFIILLIIFIPACDKEISDINMPEINEMFKLVHTTFVTSCVLLKLCFRANLKKLPGHCGSSIWQISVQFLSYYFINNILDNDSERFA